MFLVKHDWRWTVLQTVPTAVGRTSCGRPHEVLRSAVNDRTENRQSVIKKTLLEKGADSLFHD